MKMIWLVLALCVVVLVAGCVSTQSTAPVKKNNNSKPVATTGPSKYGKFGGGPVQIMQNNRQLPVRGAWISTVKNLDVRKQSTAAGYRQEMNGIFSRLAAQNVNTVFFQVRSWNDAMYPSKLNPWSRWLAGKEGKGIPGLDPLQEALNAARRRRMAFHVWLNPYRVCEASAKLNKQQILAQLAPNNFARLHPECVLLVPNGGNLLVVLDPGHPNVRKHIYNTVAEILQKYDVDGVHLDDYFYPYTSIGNRDKNTYALYNKSKLPLDTWRRNNVDNLVYTLSCQIRSTAKKKGRRIEFGISPFGIWANRAHHPAGSLTEGSESYFIQYADTRKWVQNRWIDYIVPQLYWSFNQKNAAFAGLVEWWANTTRGTGVKLYIGVALYHAASGGKWAGTDEISRQLNYMKAYPQVQGAVMFRSQYISLLGKKK